MKALHEWKSILKNKGQLVIILPNKESTFDRYRDYTSFDHSLEDYQNEVDEADDTHFEEVIRFHDIGRDTGITGKEDLVKRTSENFKNRCIHHHVFSLALLKEVLIFCGFKVLHQQVIYGYIYLQ